MFIYLSKKIAIPNNTPLHAISWNKEQGWIACGGAPFGNQKQGMLKVLKLDGGNRGWGGKQKKQGGNLSMNQTLEGHPCAVRVVTWNENFRKLTTSDESGLIIVWMHKGMWFEEMINNRNQSHVRGMKWTPDGQKICIVYEDGAVIVGSVDGNRLWGKELPIAPLMLTHVEWSPDGRYILFGLSNNEVHVYDSKGSKIRTLQIFAVQSESEAKIVGVDWFAFAHTKEQPTLATCFDNGRLQIQRDEVDENPVLIDCNLKANKIAWNSSGTVLAIAGSRMVAHPLTGEEKLAQMVQFYNPMGKHLRTLKVPGGGINAITWEGGGLRLALAVDWYIYFANIRYDYQWGYFSNTLVYSYPDPGRDKSPVLFWDTHTDARYTKYVTHLLCIRACGQRCVFATKAEEIPGQYILILCDAIGCPIASKYVTVEPMHVAMSPYHVVVASEDMVHVWQYSSPAVTRNRNRRNDGRERTFHVDDASLSGMGGSSFSGIQNDPIVALTCSINTILIGRASGRIMRYSLPQVVLEETYVIPTRPHRLALNCDSSRCTIIDVNGVLTMFDFTAPVEDSKTKGKLLEFERKDVWDMKWSDDNPELLAVMEKTKMFVIRGLHPEEPIPSSGYLCSFSDLCIKAVLLDDIMQSPEHPDKDSILEFATKTLRDVTHLLDGSIPMQEAAQFIEQNPHKRLWRLLAEKALDSLDFKMADNAFVKCSDYQGIQFVKRLQLLNDQQKQRAEVAAYFMRFHDAESIYMQMDCRDLAIELKTRLGDCFGVLHLIQQGGQADDRILTQAYDRIGDYYSDRQKWQKAQKYYAKANNLKAQVNVAYTLDDYESLGKLCKQFPQGSPFLKEVGHKFQSVGLCAEAVQCFLKAEDAKAAIDCCVLLNNWDRAVVLATEHKFPQIEGLLTKYASHLMQKQKIFQAIELYRKANRSVDAAKLLVKLAEGQKANPLRAKQLFVLAAMEMERYRAASLSNSSLKTAQQTVDTLLEHESATNNSDFADPWHGAEAFHFLILCQRQLKQAHFDDAMKTALRLTNYEDVLDHTTIYSLVALVSYYNSHYGQCSRAFIRLESMGTGAEREKYKKLAVQIFLRNPPRDPQVPMMPCPDSKCQARIAPWAIGCNSCGRNFPACVITGRPITTRGAFSCRSCKHQMVNNARANQINCPLCHSLLRSSGNSQSKSKSQAKSMAKAKPYNTSSQRRFPGQ